MNVRLVSMSKVSPDLSQKPNTHSLSNTKFFFLRYTVFLKKKRKVNHEQFAREVTRFKVQKSIFYFSFSAKTAKEIHFDLRDSFFPVTKKGEKQATNDMFVTFNLSV